MKVPDIELLFSFFLLAAFLIPAILFLRTKQNTLKLVGKDNRQLQPGLVWLELVPIVGQIWQFFVVGLIAESLRKENESRQDGSILGISGAEEVESIGKRPTLTIGIAYCLLYTIGLTLASFNEFNRGRASLLGALPGLFTLPGMVCWIIYWVKLKGWQKKLKRPAF